MMWRGNFEVTDVEPKTQYGTNPGNSATYSTNSTDSTGPDHKH